jgi:hypothetical protein
LADDVYLRGGGRITGEIVEQTEDAVTVNVGAGTLTVGVSSIVRIEKGVSPAEEYRERAKSIAAGDSESWRELAHWAASRGLATLAGEAYSHVVAVLPDDPEANRALGRVRVGGTWVTEEESYRARGYVEFEGEWMTPRERQAILEDRRALEERTRQELEALRQADEEAARAREAEKKAEHDEFWRDNLPRGDALQWGWGYAPAYWPSQPVQGQ